MIAILVPLQIYVGKVNGSIIEKVNASKDLRVKTCTEIIEGIKFIKLYGWEIAFKHIIQRLRTDEIKDYVKLSIGRSLERSIGNSSPLLAGLVCFLAVHYTGETGAHSVAKIFATMELMVTTRMIIFFFGISMGFCFELHIIFSRFSTIYNIDGRRMIQIDPLTR